MDIPGAAFVRSRQGSEKSVEDENRKQLKFIPFTPDSYQRLLTREALEKLKERERNERSQEAHLKDGELKFGMDDTEDRTPERNPDLEEGKALKPEYGVPPAYFMGLPMEEVDKGVTAKTFVVFSRWLNHVNISRFSAVPSFFILPATTPIRRLAVYLCTNQVFDFFILFTILTNCICLAVPDANNITWLEMVFFGIYSAEMSIKVMARGMLLSSYTYLRDPWNWLDMIVIASGIPSIIIRQQHSETGSNTNASATQALRTFRVLRAVKTISIFPGLRTIVNAMLRAIKMLMEVVLLTMFCLLVFSLVSVQLYRGTLRQKCVLDPKLLENLRRPSEPYHIFYRRMLKDPDNWEQDDIYLCGNTTGAGRCNQNYTCQGNIGENPNYGFMNFDNVFFSALIMFQLMTIDYWENAYRKVLLTNGYLAVIFFILTVFFGSFYLLNLMLAVVTITYQEEAEKTHKEMESENASKRQRKQAVSTFYNMTTLATKQNLWAKLIKENKTKEKDKESPLQKLVRLRAAIHVWQKLGRMPTNPVEASRAVFFQDYATEFHSALDIMQTVAYCFEKWKAKSAFVRRMSQKRDSKRLRFNVLRSHELEEMPDDFEIPPSLKARTLRGKDLENVSRSSCSFSMGSVLSGQTDTLSLGSTKRAGSLPIVADLKRKVGKKGKNGEEQTHMFSAASPSAKDNNTDAQTVSPSARDGNANAQTTPPNTAQAPRSEDHSQHGAQVHFEVTPTSNDSRDKQEGYVNEGEEENGPVYDPNRKVFTSFSQVGRQVLISAVSNMDYAKTYKRGSGMSTSRSITPTRAASLRYRSPRHRVPACCQPAVHAMEHFGSEVKLMIRGLVSDIFFDLFINFCIMLNTVFMSLEHHGMDETLERIINISGIVFTLLFDFEALLKIITFGFRCYFRGHWNRFDFIIAMLSSISVGLEFSNFSRSKWLQFLRAFRLLRILKLAQVWPAMNTLLTIIRNALAALGQLTIILAIILYIFAIIGLQLFKDMYADYQFPQGIPRWNFKDFFHSFMMMFRVLCGEWIEPLWDCMRMKGVNPAVCVLVFLPTLIFGNFVVLNLFLALLLNAFGENPTPDTQTPENKRLKEAKERIMNLLAWVLNFICPTREVHLIIHRPSHSDVVPRPEIDNAATTSEARKNAGRTDGAPMSLSLGDQTMSLSLASRDMSNADGPSAFLVSFKETKSRQGALVTNEMIQMRQMLVPQPDTTAPPCFPRFILNRTFTSRGRFNNSCYGQGWMEFRFAVMKKVKSDLFEYVILFLIIFSSIMLAFEDYDFQNSPDNTFLKELVKYASYVFAVTFTIEMLLRWIAFGMTEYFTNAWTIIDFVVVVVSVLSVVTTNTSNSEGSIVEFSDLNALRALRAFRPLRVVSRIQGMKIVVNSLMRAIPAILNVFVVSLLFWLIFCVMGVQFFSGKFFKCIDKFSQNKVNNVTTRGECNEHPDQYVWFNSYINFDSVPSGFLALFQVATFEGWMEIMQDAIDSTDVDFQPKFESSVYTYLYFVAFIICGSFFSLNLVIGVIIDNFNVLKKKYEGSYLDGFLTPTQRNYYNTLKKMSTRKPQKIIYPPRNRFQLMFYNLSVSDRFELLMMVVVCLNMLLMGVEYSSYKLPCAWYEVIWLIDVGFCWFFDLEAIFKIVGLRLYYFTLPWNCYDFFVAVVSTIDVISHLFDQYNGIHLARAKVDPTYAKHVETLQVLSPIFLRLLRISRISRVLRIIKVAKGLRKVIFSLVISLPAIINIMALLMLCLYIYAIFGVFLFSYVKLSVGSSGALTPMMNFRAFKNSFLLLLSLSTAAGWNDVLDPLLVQPPFCNNTHHQMDDGRYILVKGGDCGSSMLAVPYMVSYIILTYLFIINMYIAVILENYNQAHQQDEVGVTEDDFDMFYTVWQRYDPHATQYIAYTQLSDLVADLDTPLGIAKPNEIALVSVNLPILQGDRVHCLDILLALVKNVLTDIDESDEMFSLKQQINIKFRARFPNRTKMKMISTTIERKKEDVAARTLQRAWQVFKTQQRMRLEGIEPERKSAIGGIFKLVQNIHPIHKPHPYSYPPRLMPSEVVTPTISDSCTDPVSLSTSASLQNIQGNMNEQAHTLSPQWTHAQDDWMDYSVDLEMVQLTDSTVDPLCRKSFQNAGAKQPQQRDRDPSDDLEKQGKGKKGTGKADASQDCVRANAQRSTE